MDTWKAAFAQEFANLVDADPDAGIKAFEDQSAITQFRRLNALNVNGAGVLVRPHTSVEVQRIVKRAIEDRIPLIARGGGSGVVQGIVPDPNMVVVDLSRLDQIDPLDPINGLVDVGAGTNALLLETRLQKEGWTLGHWPQSIALATIGGLVATKSIGQYSTRYGGIEDMVRGLEVVTGTGEFMHIGAPGPRRSAGPELLPLFIGSEGTLGIITRVRLRIWPLPQAESQLALTVPDFALGLTIMRRWIQSGLTPSVVRLYDPAESARTFPSARPLSVLIAIFHGPARLTEAALEEARTQALPDAALANPEFVDSWFNSRNDVSAWVPLLQQGFLVDTIEVAGSWSILADLHRRVIAQTSQVPGVLAITGHASHAYSDGANIYFTFMARPNTPHEGPRLYQTIWENVMQETLKSGGSVSHHHGVGRLKKRWIDQERGHELERLQTVRQTFDPYDLMNRGALWNH